MATNDKEESVKIGFGEAMSLLLPYLRKKILEQIRAVFLIVTYLVFFQTIVLQIPVAESLKIVSGIGLVIFGLAFFLEGLFLGLMPLGESLGVRLPQKSSLLTILIFAFLLGAGTTLAEPAIGVLKTAGSSVLPWEAPLLYLLLNRMSEALVYSVGCGVGVAVIFGMLRFLRNWSLKPLIFSLLGILLPLTIYAFFDPNLRYLSGLAWDCGAVTTGPVTVPLVVALGIGISRVTGDANSDASGFGVVTLASLFPILSVLFLGIALNTTVPQPMEEKEFWKLGTDSQEIQNLFGSEEEFEKAKEKFTKKTPLPGAKLSNSESLSSSQISEKNPGISNPGFAGFPSSWIPGLWQSFAAALQAIIPLTIFLFLFLFLVLRERIRNTDEVFLGIVLAVLGMGLFNLGIELGLGKLGTQVGSKLPAAYNAIELTEQKMELQNFDPSIVQTSIDSEGNKLDFFFIRDQKNLKSVPYSKEQFNEKTKIYEYIPTHGPIFGSNGSFIGMLVVLGFAFVMGYGATLAEPALNALGITVEEITVGTFKKSNLMQSVSLGVGTGILLGVSKILFDIPLAYLLIPGYTILLVVTYFSSEEYVNIGWDSAGVTTGPITVPLVLAMGLGVGGQVGVVEGFGILAMASVCPILSVLGIGLWVEKKRKGSMEDPDNSDEFGDLGDSI
jgi:hypothetical protein